MKKKEIKREEEANCKGRRDKGARYRIKYQGEKGGGGGGTKSRTNSNYHTAHI